MFSLIFSSLNPPPEEKREEILPRKVSISYNTEADKCSTLQVTTEDIEEILKSLAARRTNADLMETNMDISSSTATIFHINSRNRINGDSSRIPFFPSLFVSPNGHTSNSPTGTNGHRKESKSPVFSDDDIESLLREKAKLISNARPRATFVVPAPKIENNNDHDEVSHLFDGAVANSTPLGSHSGGGGAGTILHLACALDSPFALAILLVMGAEASCRHTAFRRLMLHESAASDSPKCLKLLLEMGITFCDELEGRGIQATTILPKWGMDNPKNIHPNRKSNNTAHSASNWFNSDNGAEKMDGTDSTTFATLLRACLELAKQVKDGETSDVDAARALLSKASMSDANKYVIASTCRVHLDAVNTTDGHGNTALHWASFKNSVSCSSILLSHDSNPNAIAKTSGWTPLHDAAYSDSTETLSLLISAGSDVNTKANSGATPLCFAAQEDAPHATRILLEAGADPTARCCDEEASKNSGNESGSAQQHLNRFSGYSPLHYCAHYNAHYAARILLEYHNNILVPLNKSLLTIPDLNEKLPIHIAVARGSSDVLRELLHFGASVDTGRNRSCSMSIQNDDQSTTSMISYDGVAIGRSESFDVQMVGDGPEPSSPEPYSAIVTPVSSPVLRSMIPPEPIDSPKPWNCISQRSIDECRLLIQEAELNWSPERHSIFHPRDRAAVVELLRVGKRFEQAGTGIFIELWPLVLSFCGRGWFEPGENPDNSAKVPTIDHVRVV